MPLRTEAPEEPQMNLTPMIDVVLQLVIFFMVGTQFVDNERRYDVNLPVAAEAAPLTERPDELVVNVTRAGDYYLGAQAIRVEDLELRLTEARKRYADQLVVIRGDMDCVYQQVITAVDLCRKAGIRQFQLVTRTGASEPG
jgi:biopolymer transport protein ExbD